MREIDHIVFAVKTLEDGLAYIKSKLGCQVIQGGKHLRNGTHNAVVNLGSDIYLEIIAADPDNTEISKPRWMGVDLIDQPIVTRWAIKSTNIVSDLDALKSHNPALATSFEGSRKKQDGTMLIWHMALPLPSPAVEIAPFMVDWKDSIHPCVSLPEECELLSIEFYAPDYENLEQLFGALNIKHEVHEGSTSRIKLKIKSPNGIVEI